MLQESEGRRHRFEYDAGNRLVYHAMPSGLVQHVRYTLSDRVKWEQIQSANGTVLLERSYQYDRSGLRRAMRHFTWGLIEYEYDQKGFLQRVRRNGQVTEVYSFDDTGNLIQSRDQDQTQISRGDRLTRLELSNLIMMSGEELSLKAMLGG